MKANFGGTGGIRIPFSDRLSCTVQEAVQATGLSRTTLYEQIGSGALASTTVGTRRLISVPSLLALVRASNAAGDSTAKQVA